MGDPVKQARDEVMIQLTERTGKIVDYAVQGERCLQSCGTTSPTTEHFRVQVRSPGLFRIELPGSQTVITFDGKKLVQVDGRARSVQEIDVKGSQKAATLPYQALSRYLVEGWRAPLVASTGQIPARLDRLPGQQGGDPLVVLERPIQDAELARVEFWYRRTRADFVTKRFVLKSGAVLKSVLVEQEHRDARSGYGFPKAWKTLGASDQLLGWTRLSEIRINAGVPKTAFRQDPPADYARR